VLGVDWSVFTLNGLKHMLLPSIMMFLPGWPFKVRISSTTLPRIKTELRQAAVVANVVETTYFGMPFITSPNASPACIGSNAPP